MGIEAPIVILAGKIIIQNIMIKFKNLKIKNYGNVKVLLKEISTANKKYWGNLVKGLVGLIGGY